MEVTLTSLVREAVTGAGHLDLIGMEAAGREGVLLTPRRSSFCAWKARAVARAGIQETK